MSINMYQINDVLHWLIDTRQLWDKVYLFPYLFYRFLGDFSLSEGDYVVAAVDCEYGAAQDGFHDLDRAHDPELDSKFY